MIARVIAWSARNVFLVLVATAFVVAAGVWAVRNTPLDALPDLSDVQVIVYTDYAGQAPQVVEDQVTYPLASAMLTVPRSKVVRGFSFFGAGFFASAFGVSGLASATFTGSGGLGLTAGVGTFFGVGSFTGSGVGSVLSSAIISASGSILSAVSFGGVGLASSFTGSGLVKSTPAPLSASSGSSEPPALRKSTYRAAASASPSRIGRAKACAPEMPVAY